MNIKEWSMKRKVGGALGIVLLSAVAINGVISQPSQQECVADAPVAEATVTFAPGKTEADIINEAAVCRLVNKGYAPQEIRNNPALVANESHKVLEQYIEGEIGLAGLYSATQELCWD